MDNGPLLAALDQGTTSTRFIIFDRDARVVGRAQAEHRQVRPRPGWAEHDPVEILERSRHVIAEALSTAGLTPTALAAVGLANQRETTVVWDTGTGEPLGPALVWHDTRTTDLVRELRERGMEERVRAGTGLPLATYFSAAKLAWLLRDSPELRAAARRGAAAFGTIDSWLVWNLTGGPRGGRHVIDPTNAARTQLADLRTSTWDGELLDLFGIPESMLPEISPRPDAAGNGEDIPVHACLGDQHAALLGQACLTPGDAKNTYGTGSFLLMNTGLRRPEPAPGLLATLGFDLGPHGRTYALEGSVPVAGSLFDWLRDQAGLIGSAAESESLAQSVPDSAGVFFVPAFSGLFSPLWRPDARGVIVGLTAYTSRAHLVRAAIEAIGHQTADVVEAMCADVGVTLSSLRVDGGITANGTCMQAQADLLGVPVRRAAVAESTALGAAFAAGLATGAISRVEEISSMVRYDREWEPCWSPDRRESARAAWRDAVTRSLNLADRAS